MVQEPSELMDQNGFDFIGLLDLDAVIVILLASFFPFLNLTTIHHT